MFHDIPQAVREQMDRLEGIDAQDRVDGTPRPRRLRQIPPETGRFLALLAAGAPAGQILELGTSAGYSTLWLALACRETGRCMTSIEADEKKILLARETFRRAGVEDVVGLVHGDALEVLGDYREIAFCFLDLEKELYEACYEPVIQALVPGGLLVADNLISHAEALRPMLGRAMQDPRVDAVVVPIGKGELLCRRS